MTKRLTGARATLTLLRNKWSGTPVTLRVNLLVPSQAGSLPPSCPFIKWRKAEGILPKLSPEVLPVFKTGYRDAVLRLPLTKVAVTMTSSTVWA
jgi:hypothetical protein